VKSKNTVLLVFFFMAKIAFSQTIVEKEIHGKISVDSMAVEGVNIVNTVTERTVVTDQDGSFSLFAKEGDILVFSAVNLETLRKKINKLDLISDVMKIQMILRRLILKEVIVNKYPEITAEKLGIIPYGQKKYTAAERKLYTAGDFKPIHLLGLLAGSLEVDPILNKINGRTAMLKKEIEVEKKESYLRQINEMFTNDHFVNKLKIPSNYVKGFQYYIVENERFVVILKSKNKINAEFAMADLAIKYNEIITGEK
jgi:hypothetical protein